MRVGAASGLFRFCDIDEYDCDGVADVLGGCGCGLGGRGDGDGKNSGNGVKCDSDDKDRREGLTVSRVLEDPEAD